MKVCVGAQQQQEQKERTLQIATDSAYHKIPLPTMRVGNVESYFTSLDFWFVASDGVNDDNRKYNKVKAQVPLAKLLELRPII